MLNELLKQTQDCFGITSKELASAAGISAQHWSEFRRGNANITTGKLWDVLAAMNQINPKATIYFCKLLSEAVTGTEVKTETVGQKLEALISCADQQELAAAMLMIAKRWNQSINVSSNVNVSNETRHHIARV